MRSYPEQVIILRSATKLHVIIAHRWRLITIVRKVIKSSGLLMVARATAVLDLAEGREGSRACYWESTDHKATCPYHAASDGGRHIPCDTEPDISARLLEGLRTRGSRHLPSGFCFEAAAAPLFRFLSRERCYWRRSRKVRYSFAIWRELMRRASQNDLNDASKTSAQ